MEHPRQKRARDDESSSSESADNRSRPTSESGGFAKIAASVSPPLPKLISSENPQVPQKKPKLWDYDPKKSVHSLHSGILQCVKVVQDSIRESDYDSMLFSLKKLSNELTMSNDEHLSMLPIDILTEALIYVLNVPNNPEIILQAIICITFLIESHHNAVPSFVKAGIINLLTSKLTNIEYIDVAEYAVKALEKISVDFPVEVLKESFITETFAMLEFFEQNVQKKMLGIILNISRASVNLEDFKRYLAPSLPIIINLLQNKAKDLAFQNEKALEILLVLTESLRVINAEEVMNNVLIEFGVIQSVLNNIQDLPVITVKCFKLLVAMCRNSLKVTIEFINYGVVVIKNVVGSAILESNSVILTETLQLIHSIIPNENDLNGLRKGYFIENIEGIHRINEIVFTHITSIYEILIKKNIKILYLEIIYNLINISHKESILLYQDFSAFLSNLLVEKEASILKASLKIVSILYDKIPEIISTNFIREGVVQRFKALKCPENLKHVMEDKYSDPIEFEQFLVNYRRSRAFSETQELAGAHARPRLLSECRDNTLDQKKEIISLSKAIIDKHNACQNHSAFSTSKALKSLSQALETKTTESATEIWKELGTILDNLSPTAYELSSSSLANTIWDYLFGKSPDLWKSRYENFLEFLLHHSSTGQSYFVKVLSLFMNTFSYHENFIISGNSKSSFSRGYSHKTRINLVYLQSAKVTEEIQSRDSFFMEIGRFSIAPDPRCSVGILKSLLKKVVSKEDLSLLKETIREDPMDIEDPLYMKSIKIKITSHETEINDDVLLGDFTSISQETPTLKFQFTSELCENNFLYDEHSVFSFFVSTCSSVGLDPENPAYPYLRFLNLLFLSSFHNPLSTHKVQVSLLKQPISTFINAKLNSLINKQFQEPISVSRRALPLWMKELPKYSWFLFTYSTRLKILDNFRFMHSESFRPPRQKLKIERENILEGAMVIMSDVSMLQQKILEIQYENEIGTGNGPTLEFFTILSQEIRNLEIWRKSTMLFPAPLEILKVNYFNFIGKVVGKAILDKRYIELPLSPVFWKMVQKKPVSMIDIQEIDPSLYKTLSDLQELVTQNGIDSTVNTFKGVPLEDLHIFFTLPGYENIELKPEGRHIPVTMENLSEYLILATQKTLLQIPQVNDFREGVCTLIPIESLLGFSAEELEEMICGSSNEVWDISTLKASIKPAHGYSENSATFQNLLIVMSEFTIAEQRKFLQFTTGFPRLPLGGFFGMVPSLTVVRKEDEGNADNYLPSVMTCQNYLKLPNYSDIQVLRKNLYLALEEGHQTFHLS